MVAASKAVSGFCRDRDLTRLLDIGLLWDGRSIGPGIARCKIHFAAAVTGNGRALAHRE
jgi:hypothetical protein